MLTQLPPLTALRCFEAAARRESYTLAAEELFLTPSAVSHQIRALETTVTTQLFVRVGRKMVLTDMGASYYERIRGAFKEIISATQSVSEARGDSSLKINVLPHFASAWLIPRLSNFLSTHPSCNLRIFSSRDPVVFSETNIDCDIRYGHGRWPGLCSDLLVRDVVTPLCSPNLIKNPSLKQPVDLANETLIYGFKRTNWDIWVAQYQLPAVGRAKKLPLGRSTLALDAAIAGLGFALESVLLANQAMTLGQLVAPFPECSISVDGYYIVYPKGHCEKKAFKIFRSWIIGLLREERQNPQNLMAQFGVTS